MKHRAVAIVRWLDATKRDGVFDRAFEVAADRVSVGFVLRHDDEGIVLAMSDDGPEYGYEFGLGIPTAYITEVRYLDVELRSGT